MTVAALPRFMTFPLMASEELPVARNLDTEFGWQRDDLASALLYQEEISIPDAATTIQDARGAESNSDLGTGADNGTTQEHVDALGV